MGVDRGGNGKPPGAAAAGTGQTARSSTQISRQALATTSYHSRAVEYKIDETAKTATLVWEFPGTFTVDAWCKTNFYLPFWGDADRLANGNVLITAGVRFTTIQSRVFEVTKSDGKVVWEFQLPLGFGVYRAERLSPPPLVHAVSP